MVKRFFMALLLLVLILALCGCQRQAAVVNFSNELAKTEKLYTQKKMLHLQQVVEYYDAAGNPLPRYFELFTADGKKTGYELDAKGNVNQVYQDTKDRHISYDLETLKAKEYDASPVFSIDLALASKDKTRSIVKLEPYTYCGRACHVYGILSDNEDENIKLYIDDETGYALFCDTPLFCIKTASIEILPYDAGCFKIPEDLIFE